MRDSFGREIDYVRISLTDRCQLRCTYCISKEDANWLKPCEKLTSEEIIEMVTALTTLGIKKLKLTGGEPLLYPNLISLIMRLKQISGIKEITLTTNGIKLPEMIDSLVEAGLDGINISLDTLDPDHYASLTKIGQLKLATKGLNRALKSSIKQVKINSVLIDSLTEKEAIDLMKLAKTTRAHVRFIEWMPIGHQKPNTHLTEQSIKQLIEANFGPVKASSKRLGNGPARYYEVEGFKGKIGFISAVTQHFCHQCNRLRITSDGVLKTCLALSGGTNLKKAIQQENLEQTLIEALKKKPEKHLFGEPTDKRELKNMRQIGG